MCVCMFLVFFSPLFAFLFYKEREGGNGVELGGEDLGGSRGGEMCSEYIT